MIQWMQNVIPQPPYIASIFHYYLSDQLEGYLENSPIQRLNRY